MAKMPEDLIRLLRGVRMLTKFVDMVRASGSRHRKYRLACLLSSRSLLGKLQRDPVGAIRAMKEELDLVIVHLKWKKRVRIPRAKGGLASLAYKGYILNRSGRVLSPSQARDLKDFMTCFSGGESSIN